MFSFSLRVHVRHTCVRHPCDTVLVWRPKDSPGEFSPSAVWALMTELSLSGLAASALAP